MGTNGQLFPLTDNTDGAAVDQVQQQHLFISKLHFLKKRNRMSGKTVQKDRKLSSKLVHIEQVIGLAKSFKILTLASNRTEAKLVSDISFVVVQFQKNALFHHLN
jgi:hypothetical protein